MVIEYNLKESISFIIFKLEPSVYFSCMLNSVAGASSMLASVTDHAAMPEM